MEAYGPGVGALSLETRATIGNMAPEYGATCAIFPVDQVTVDYLTFTGRPPEQVALVEAYAKAQGMWHDPSIEPVFSEYAELDLSSVVPSLAGPSRPQDRVDLASVPTAFRSALGREPKTGHGQGAAEELTDGAIAVAAITSCTNTSNPSVLIAAGLVAKRAIERGLSSKPWVKTSLAPGSRVVMDYLDAAGLSGPLDQLGFWLVGYGCTTCIGNSGPLFDGISDLVTSDDLTVTSVLSGNRNFEGRIHPDIKQNYLASPPLVVAYALAGTVDIDLTTEPIGTDRDGNPVMLSELWPSDLDVAEAVHAAVTPAMFKERYAAAFEGDVHWQAIDVAQGETFAWDQGSTYVRRPSFLENLPAEPAPVNDIVDARILAKLGNSVTTDHISPAGSIKANLPAGTYLTDGGVSQQDFNSYGTRRGNHEVMVRGTFANVRLRNQLAPGTEGGVTTKYPEGEQMSMFDASMRYQEEGTPLVILAGTEYGSGSSRDWAAKGTKLLGVKAVIVESYERIHRSNLVGMGILPLQYPADTTAQSLGLDGDEVLTITGIDALNSGEIPKSVRVMAKKSDGSVVEFDARVRIDTPTEADYFRHGGVIPFVLRQLAAGN